MKNKIIGYTKFVLLVSMMTMGFFYTYLFTWFAIGLPQTHWAMIACGVLASVSEFAYIKWVSV